MLRTLLPVLAGLSAGFAVAWWLQPGIPAPAATPPGATALVATNDDSARRLARLEQTLLEEVAERAVLEARVAELADVLEDTIGSPPAAAGPSAAPADEAGGPRARFGRDGVPPRDDAQNRRRQVERLIAAGFPPDRAEWIDRRTSELRMQALQAQYDATREGRPFEPAAVLAAGRTLRGELGDADYERYLQALGRPTSVAVQNVLASSPAERSGLQPGDAIVSYDGQRVFDQRELNALTLEGNSGESVVVGVQRDGQTIQLVLPRGPIGILSGGFRGR
jgi:hypothetical protein